MKKKCLTLILSVLAFLGCMRMVVQAFPASAMIGIQNTLQEKTNWCWAACCTSCIKYYGNTVSQGAFVYYVKGSTDNVTAYFSEMQTGLSHYNISSHYASGTITYNDIMTHIYTSQRPVIAGTYIGGPVGHAIVIKGYATNSGTNYVLYMDPWTGSQQSSTYSTFSMYWICNLDNIHN